MSYKAKFKVAGAELNVLDASYSMHQEVDVNGRPSSVTRGGKIMLTVDSTEENELFEWMCNNFERKDGSIIFYTRAGDTVLKELKFKEGYLVNFEEVFHTGDEHHPMTISLTISAREISLGNGTHRNEWV